MADPSLSPSAPERFATERRAQPRAPFRQNRRARERVTILGQAMDLVKPEEVLHHIQQAVRQSAKSLIANHNLHSLYLMQKRPELGAFYDKADLIEVDSTPLIWFSRALGLHSRPFHRCTYLDWRGHFWSLADREGWRVMAVGGAPGVGETAARRRRREAPRREDFERVGISVVAAFVVAASGRAVVVPARTEREDQRRREPRQQPDRHEARAGHQCQPPRQAAGPVHPCPMR